MKFILMSITNSHLAVGTVSESNRFSARCPPNYYFRTAESDFQSESNARAFQLKFLGESQLLLRNVPDVMRFGFFQKEKWKKTNECFKFLLLLNI